MIQGDWAYLSACLHSSPDPLRARTLSLEPRSFRLRAIGTDSYPNIVSRGRAAREWASLRTIDVEDPDLDAWVRALFRADGRGSGASEAAQPCGLSPHSLNQRQRKRLVDTHLYTLAAARAYNCHR